MTPERYENLITSAQHRGAPKFVACECAFWYRSCSRKPGDGK